MMEGSGYVVTDDQYSQLTPSDHLNITEVVGSRKDGFYVTLGGCGVAAAAGDKNKNEDSKANDKNEEEDIDIDLSKKNEKEKELKEADDAFIMKKARVHVIATHFVPAFDFLSCMDILDAFIPQTGSSNREECLYLEQRTLGEEYRYVLERAKCKQFVGNSLERPSLLTKPLEHKSTSTSEKLAAAGGSIQSMGLGAGGAVRHKSRSKHVSKKTKHVKVGAFQRSNKKMNRKRANDTRILIDFLGTTSAVITNLKVDKSGRVFIDPTLIDYNHQMLQIIAMTDEELIIKTEILEPTALSLDADSASSSEFGNISGLAELNKMDVNMTDMKKSSFIYFDNRLTPGLDPTKQFLDDREIFLMHGRNDTVSELKIDDFNTSEIETYET